MNSGQLFNKPGESRLHAKINPFNTSRNILNTLLLPAFCVGDESGKVWPTFVTTQQVGIYPKILLGFATYCMSSPAPIYLILSVKTTELQ